MYRNFQEAADAWNADKAMWEEKGLILPQVTSYAYDAAKRDFHVAMDAQPTLGSDPNSSIPWVLTNFIDPQIYEWLFAPNNAVKIFGEAKKGDWLLDTVMFPVVESTGEVSSYGDYATSGLSGANMNWPQRQNYLFQTIKRYGERELARAGLGKINWVGELDKSAAVNTNKFFNLTYFYGVQGLQNFGAFNDPNLNASLTPAAKSYGGTSWMSSGVIKATANEIYLDIQDLFIQLVTQLDGLVDAQSKMVLALSPISAACLNTTNSFNVNVYKLLKDNYPNLRIETAVQYGAASAQNSQGNSAGNFMQLIADSVEGQQSCFCAYSEKMRAHAIIKEPSAFLQKVTSGTWGTVIRLPAAIAGMVGI